MLGVYTATNKQGDIKFPKFLMEFGMGHVYVFLLTLMLQQYNRYNCQHILNH